MAPRYLVKICASLPLFTTNPIWNSLGWNPVSTDKKPVNNSLSHGIDLNKIPIIIFSRRMQLVRDLIGKWHQWYKYSHLNLNQIRSGLFSDIFFDVFAYTGKEHRLLQVCEVFCVIPIYNWPLHLKIKFTRIIFISRDYGHHYFALHDLTAMLALIICVKQCCISSALTPSVQNQPSTNISLCIRHMEWFVSEASFRIYAPKWYEEISVHLCHLCLQPLRHSLYIFYFLGNVFSSVADVMNCRNYGLRGELLRLNGLSNTFIFLQYYTSWLMNTISPLKTKISMNYIFRFISYQAVDTLRLDCKHHTVSRFDIPVVCEYNMNRCVTVNTTTNLII